MHDPSKRAEDRSPTACDGGTAADSNASAAGGGRSRGSATVAAHPDADVYRLEIGFTASSSSSQRAAVVEELAEHLLTVSDVDGRSHPADDTRSLRIATGHDVSAVRTALEELPIVDRVTVDGPDRDAQPPSVDRRERPAAEREQPTPSRSTFGDVKRHTDSLDVHDLLEDPEYVQFLDDFGELSGPEDEVSLAELLTDTAPTSGSSDRPNDAARSESADPTPDRRTVVDRLVAELESERVSADRRERLGALLGEESSASLEARVTHLQSRFHELASYIDAMEAFIDDNGDAESLLEGVRTDLEELQDALDTLERTQTVHANRLAAVEDELEANADRWERLSAALRPEKPE